MKMLWIFIKWLLIIIVLLVLGVTAFITLHPVFGGSPDKESQKKISVSQNANGKIFKNQEATELGMVEVTEEDSLGKNMGTGIMSFFNPPTGKLPTQALPSYKLDKTALHNGDFVWLGHSSILFKTDDKIFITDPVFYRASPMPFTGKAFAVTQKTHIADLPPIDAVLISHDHYDHLDYRTIQELNEKVGHFYVPLGVKAHLQRWGVNNNKVTELDWYEQAKLGDINLILTPSRHFSGRNVYNRNSTLWGSWVVKSPSLALFFSGDSGYGKHFKEIGEKYGPFDLALLEDGAYNLRWAQIHMLPEQSVQAALDLRAKAVLPIHWGKFDLAFHPWKEPIQRFFNEAEQKHVKTITPVIGEIFNTTNPPTNNYWWDDVQ